MTVLEARKGMTIASRAAVNSLTEANSLPRSGCIGGKASGASAAAAGLAGGVVADQLDARLKNLSMTTRALAPPSQLRGPVESEYLQLRPRSPAASTRTSS